MEAGIRLSSGRSIVLGPYGKQDVHLLAVVSVTEKRPEDNCKKPTRKFAGRGGMDMRVVRCHSCGRRSNGRRPQLHTDDTIMSDQPNPNIPTHPVQPAPPRWAPLQRDLPRYRQPRLRD
jgi:hypothetical protein